MTAGVTNVIVNDAVTNAEICAVNLCDFMQKEFMPRTNLLNPVVPEQGLVMVYGPRGIAKTFVSTGIAAAIAGGGAFLGWNAPEPKPVVFIDGEMPANALQERFAIAIDQMTDEKAANAMKNVTIITPDLQPLGMPDLSTLEGQVRLDDIVEPASLIILDNISTLCRSGRENEAESWGIVQEWALRMRSRGKSVVFIHHAGKGGQQRGTSRREDVLDTVIALRRPNDYEPKQGARFEVHIEKARHLYGDDLEPFEAWLQPDNEGFSWTFRMLEDTTYDKVVRLGKDGLSQKEISIALGLNKSTVSRHFKRAKSEGVMP